MHDRCTEEHLDPAIANDWFAIAHCGDVAAGHSIRRRLLQRNVTVHRDQTGALTTDGVAVREHCGHVMVCLGSDPKPLFDLPEFAQAGRRFVYMGALGLHTGGLRVVENFLDMAHFPFVHSHILGSEQATEVRPYEVEFDDGHELWARGCKFVQPMASAASEGAADVDYAYRVVNPFSPLLYKFPDGGRGESDIIFLLVQPTEEDECIVHFSISLFDEVNSATDITSFQQTILGQDKPILENHVYKRLPLDARLEVPSQADAGSTAYRRWLRRIGLRWGVEPTTGEADGPMQLVVADKRSIAEGITAFELRSPVGGPLPPTSPGAHLDIHLPNGLVRQYSVCNAGSDEDFYTIAVKREPQSRGGSQTLHEQIEPGALLRVGTPKNNFPLDAEAAPSLLIAGGIGITPLISMARSLQGRGLPFHLHYFCRTPAQAAFGDALEQKLPGQWTLHAGLTPEATRLAVEQMLQSADAGTHVYCCGPAPLMQLVEAQGRASGWSPGRLRFEYFKSARQVDLHGEPFDLTLARSGRTIRIPGDRGIVEVLRSIDIAIDTNCEQGVCGTCLCTVIDGTPEHRDQYLTPGEKATNLQMLPCVSRSRTPSLVLDL